MAGGAAQGVGPEFKPQYYKKTFFLLLQYSVYVSLT
jgi:hypothetical protein